MISIDIPGRAPLRLERLVTDYNGTLACDGHLFPDAAPLLRELAAHLEIHVVTADTFGLARAQLADLPVTLTILPAANQDQGKLDYVTRLGLDSTVCMGNGQNDALMLKAAALGICLVEAEGTCVHTLLAADVACRSTASALDLLLHPKRLIATLRR